MLKIVGTEIHLTKGDSAYLNIEITNNKGVPYSVQNGDKVVMTVRNALNGTLLFQKKVDADSAIVIEPADTLNASTGRYKYDIELTTASEDVFTIIPKSFFFLEEEVTHE